MRYTLRETWSGLRRNASMAMAVVVTMWVSLSLFGMGLLAAQQVDLIKGRWYDRIEITVFMCNKDSQGANCEPGQDTTDAQRTAIRTALEENPEVQTVFYQSKQEVFEEFRDAYSDSPILPSMTADNMQDLFRIKLVDPQEYQGVRSAVIGLPGVQAVQDLRQYLDPLFEWLNLGQWLTVGASGLLLVAASLQIVNTIRMAAFSRRRELGIMRLVGASNFYILAPFLLESLIAALVGALLACGTLIGMQEFVINERARPAVQTIQWVGWEHVGVALVGVVIVAVLLSMMPTLVATRRYLRV